MTFSQVAVTASMTALAAFAQDIKPLIVSATPNSGTGMQQTFTLVYAHPKGATALTNVALLLNNAIDGRNSCWITYDPSYNRLWLVADNQLNWKFGTPGTNSTLSNRQCTVNLSASNVRHDGTNLTLNLALAFSSSFAGTKTLYMRAVDATGATTNYVASGTWTVAAAASPASGVAVAPASGFGIQQSFMISYANSAGVQQLTALALHIPSSSKTGACWAVYDVVNRYMSLASDDTATWSYASIGQPGQLSNSQCSIDPQQITATTQQTAFTLQLSIAFQTGFTGFKTISVTAFDGSASPSTASGMWDVLSPAEWQALSQPKSSDIGAHWPDKLDDLTLNSLGYHFGIVTVNPSDQNQIADVLNRAAAANLQLIIGAYPSPYVPNPDGSWTISADGISFIKQLATHASTVRAIFVFDEPYWLDPVTQSPNACGATSAQQLRNLRQQIKSIWPDARIYHDLGDPQSWAPGGVSWQPCVGNKFADQSGVADYVGIWRYPFTNGGYDRQGMLDFAYNASRYVLQSMSPARPIFLGQTYACPSGVCGLEYSLPTSDQLKDLNCSVRSVLPAGSSLSWYVWRQGLYSDYLSNHSELWPATMPGACSTK